MSAKILTFDIETSPGLADVWALWDQNVGLSQLREVTSVICVAAKWHGNPKVEFYSQFHDGHDEMLRQAYRLLDEADIVVHFNGTSFDMPHLNREFILAGMTPYSPVQEIDLLRVVKSRFKFMSNKLAHVSTQLGLEGKLEHSGHELWVQCLQGDEKAWATMRKYNMQDVRLTEQLYDRLRPWVKSHPHLALLGLSERGEGEGLEHVQDACARCASVNLEKRGMKAKGISVFQQYRCRECGSWSTGSKALYRADARGVA